MAELINLNRARKTRRRAEQTAVAAENRALHGRSRTERETAAATQARADRALDQHRRED